MKVKHEYTVNEFAKLCNTTVRTINHYEQLGLIQPWKVLDNGYRIFSIHQVDQISSILLYKDYGFSLKQIKELIANNDLESQIHHLNLQKEIIESQKKSLLDKEKRIHYTLEEIKKATSQQHMHFSFITEQTISITPVLNESDRYFINYLSDGFRSGVIINPFFKRITGFFSTEENGSKTISGNCLCFYMKSMGFDTQTALRMFTEAALAYSVPLSDIYAETIIETNDTFLIKYFMMIDHNQ